MLSSLPQLIGNYITHNRMYGLAVFCRKDSAFSAGSERGGGGGERERGGQDNFHEEGELLAWESDMDSEDERFSSRRPITVALVENNCINQNGGETKRSGRSYSSKSISSKQQSFIYPVCLHCIFLFSLILCSNMVHHFLSV